MGRGGGYTDHNTRKPRDGWGLATATNADATTNAAILAWRVPAGTRAHLKFVAAATLAARYAAALFVAVTVWRAPKASRFARSGSRDPGAKANASGKAGTRRKRE